MARFTEENCSIFESRPYYEAKFEVFYLYAPKLSLYVLNFNVLEYVGCYKDSDPRDLPQRVHGREITVRSCAKSCKELYYRYAGLQFSYLCFCGNKRGRYGMLPEWKCSSECSDKKDKRCGGYWSNSIYKTGKSGVPVN